MNKSDLIEKLASQKGVTKKRAEGIVNVIFEMMTDSLVGADRIEIRGFGSFTTRTYKGYKGRDPRNGRGIEVTPKKLPYFKASKKLLAELNGLPTDGMEDDSDE